METSLPLKCQRKAAICEDVWSLLGLRIELLSSLHDLTWTI